METNYKGTNKLLLGIVLGVLTFWLFAQAMVNIVPAVQADLGISLGTLNIAISLSALFSGIFIVAAGGLADKVGRKKITYIGLVLSVIGSACIIFAQGAFLLIIGRAIQGLSAAAIMPATIALIKDFYHDEDRQRALSYWSIGSWGGSGICSFAGGAIATYMGWRWIFVFSIIIALLAMYFMKDVPESKVKQQQSTKFDYTGLLVFIIVMLTLNIAITRGEEFGWASLTTIGLFLTAIIGGILFFRIVSKKEHGFIDISLFKRLPYSGATISNFFLNAVAGTLVVANTYVQVGRGFTAFQSGMLSIGYLVAVLVMIRVGEKILQRIGARKPMLWGTIINAVGISLMALTFLPDFMYTIAVFIGFALFGLGLGMYATPSTDTAVMNAPDNKIGEASGIYKMASSLGGAFGVSISTAVYSAIYITGNVNLAGTMGLLTNVLFAVIALISIIFMIPSNRNDEELIQDELPE